MAADVKFIIGRSGSGKTHAVYSLIAENERAGRRSVLIVPDRATFETERELSAFLGGGILHASVISFTRLARRVLDGAGDRRAYLSAQGRQMLVRRVLDAASNDLVSFSRVASRRGFAAECDEIILKCKRFSITPEQLSNRNDLPETLRGKLNDFALIYSAMLEKTADRYIDGEDMINAMIDLLPDSSLHGADIFIDAPDMMNAQSVRIVDKLFSVAARVTLTFRLDPSENPADKALFEPDRLSFERLSSLASSSGCRVRTVSLSGNKRHPSGALAALEGSVFAYPFNKYADDARNIELHASLDRPHEVREAAEKILSAVKSGLRFRDIAVACPELPEYAGEIRRRFAACAIPFFIDAGRSLAAHPVSRLIVSALRCVRGNFRSEDFVGVLKSGLTGVSEDDAEKLENHILKYALEGRRLFEDGPSVKKHDEIKDFEAIEAARLTVARPILALKERLSAEDGRTADAKVAALYGYLQSLRAADKLSESSAELMEDPSSLVFALEDRQIYDKLIELLDQIHVILSSELIGLERFISVVEEGLAAYEVQVIPTTLDQVLVGDAGAMHLPKVRLLLVLGANEGHLPHVRGDDQIINDRELAVMRSAGIPAWDTTESMNRAEKLRLYSLITKPSDALYVSYCGSLGSETASPSMLVSRIGAAFPHCARTSGLVEKTAAGTDETAFSDLADALRRFIDTGEAVEGLDSLYAHFASSDYKQALEKLVSMCFEENSPAPLGHEAAMRLYGTRATGTPTRLETFNRCPFCYLMQYGLNLKERELREERAVDHGTLIHDALDLLMKDLMAEKADFSLLTKEDLTERLDRILPPLFEDHNNGILLDSALMRAEAERLREELIGIAQVIVSQISSGSFEPYASELGFGRRDDALPALELRGENGVTFRVIGVVDRVDSLKTPVGGHFRIIDYKTGAVSFDYSELASGLRLQLPLYAAAVQAALASEKLAPSGLYYMHVTDPATMAGDEEQNLKLLRSEMRLSGPTVSDEGVLRASDGTDFRYSLVIEGLSYSKKEGRYKGKSLVSEAEMAHAIDFAKNLGMRTLNAIMDGRAEVSPSKAGAHIACAYCPYQSICRFDTSSGGKYRHICAVKADKFFNRKETE